MGVVKELIGNLNGFLELSNGAHTLSGIGSTTIHDDFLNEDIDVDLFCIDGITFGAYIDPDDGYRSYGCFYKINAECDVKFPPQNVIIENLDVKGQVDDNDPYGWCGYEEDKSLLRIPDAESKEIVLEIGTDYFDSWYPMAIHYYKPENLAINKGR